MRLTFDLATEADAAPVAAVRSAAARELTRLHGAGHWSAEVDERGALRGIRAARVVVARDAGEIVGTLCLQTKKPWAIDRSYFAPSKRPIYLVDMAVHPDHQRRGVGRALLEEATRIVRAWPGDAVRLDAYEGPAGAGAFYTKCGWREVGRATYRGVPLIYYEWLIAAE